MGKQVDWQDLRGEVRQILKRAGVAEERLTPATHELEATLKGRVEALAEAEVASLRLEIDTALGDIAHLRQQLAQERARLAEQVRADLEEAMGYEAHVGRSILVVVQAAGAAWLSGMEEMGRQTAPGTGA